MSMRAAFACSARTRSGNTAQVTGSVGYLSQRFSLYGDLSIDENIAFFAEIHGVSDFHARRDRLLEMTQLTRFRDRLADQLSGGMKQKLALACTLVHEPQVIVLDEPTTGVDPVSRREFWKLLSQFLAQGITILMSTPYLDEAERCSRIVLLHEGKVLALDQPANLRASLPGNAVRSDRAVTARSARPLDGPARHRQRAGVRRSTARLDRSRRRRCGDARVDVGHDRRRHDAVRSSSDRAFSRRRLHRQTRRSRRLRGLCVMTRISYAS